MQKKFKHVKLGYIAKQSNDQYKCYNALGDYFTHIPTQLIENSSDWVEVKKKEYTSIFWYGDATSGKLVTKNFSTKYADKLSTLDILLCLRDEYNLIDGFVPNYRINSLCEGYQYGIIFNGEELVLSWTKSKASNMSFNSQQTAGLFLNNFRTQLEEVKELL